MDAVPTLSLPERAPRAPILAALVVLAALAAVPIVPGLAPWGPSAVRGHLAEAGVAGPRTEAVRPARLVAPLSVTIWTPPVLYAGAPDALTAHVQGGVPPYRYSWNDSQGETGEFQTFGMMVYYTGSITVAVTVWDAVNDSAEAWLALDVNGPSIGLFPSEASTDAGLPIPFAVDVAGGTPPYTLTWTTLPDGAPNVTHPAEAALWYVHAESDVLGLLWVQATVTDANGLGVTIEGVIADILPAPSIILAPPNPGVAAGSLGTLSGTVLGGSPPFVWTVAPDRILPDADNDSTVTGDGMTLSWTARFPAPGPIEVLVTLTDAVGQRAQANTTIDVLAPLVAILGFASARPVAGGALDLSLNLSGGAAPYTVELELSDGESARLVAPTSGPLTVTVHPKDGGPLAVQAVVDDASGASVTVTATADLDPPVAAATVAPSGGSGSALTAGAGLLVLLAAFAALVVLWRRRHRTATTSDATARAATSSSAVERILRDSEGLDRSAVKLLAESDGVRPEEVDAALGALLARGAVRAEEAPDGGERLRWVAAEDRSGSGGGR